MLDYTITFEHTEYRLPDQESSDDAIACFFGDTFWGRDHFKTDPKVETIDVKLVPDYSKEYKDGDPWMHGFGSNHYIIAKVGIEGERYFFEDYTDYPQCAHPALRTIWRKHSFGKADLGEVINVYRSLKLALNTPITDTLKIKP